MALSIDIRLIELKVLSNIADQTWSAGLVMTSGAGQHKELGISQQLYADMVLTLMEDGHLDTEDPEIKRLLCGYIRRDDPAERAGLLNRLRTYQAFLRVNVTYRGLRRVEQLREQLRRDRILESFGILLDGRYIVSDLIHLLERTDGDSLSLLLADIDDFKKFNSDHGYKAGDAVLRQVFRLFKQIVSNRGEVYRRGGEEIVALLPFSKIEEGRSVAERIREEVRKTPVAYDGKELHVTLSIGVAASPPCNPDGPALEVHAENGLKQAKASGKNCVVVNP
jgi:diguanylate cyclase (GGDEF)-like protein